MATFVSKLNSYRTAAEKSGRIPRGFRLSRLLTPDSGLLQGFNLGVFSVWTIWRTSTLRRGELAPAPGNDSGPIRTAAVRKPAGRANSLTVVVLIRNPTLQPP